MTKHPSDATYPRPAATPPFVSRLLKISWMVLVLVWVLPSALAAQNPAKKIIPISGNWSFRQLGKSEWLPASVPGNVHMDLFANKKIADPFWGTNEKTLQWIEKESWEYLTMFQVEKAAFTQGNAVLVFKGLDTYAEVFLNDHKILDAFNMFREWKVDVKKHLKAGKNTLKIVFRSPILEVLPLYRSLPFQYPANNDQAPEKVSIFTRKAGFHYGWDWGPRFVTSGIWRPILLETWNHASLSDVQIIQKSLTREMAELVVRISVSVATPGSYQLNVHAGENAKAVPLTLALKAGKNVAEIPLTIPQPNIWWPNGLGDHPLYTVHTILSFAGQKLEEQSLKTGLRTVEVVHEKDQDGKSLYLKINGVPVFMKGANYIPSDNFQNRVDDKKYQMLVQSAVDANMNMLRVWGGGIYEEDRFYDLCDENGILVWQDFMFGCSMYPGNEPFLKNVEAEATDNARRLRNHASIALWCGNNEIETAWKNWGWQKQFNYSQATQDSLWKDYKRLFHELLPAVISREDAGRFYHRSSPSANDDQVGPDVLGFGDKHYWGVWHAEEPYRAYLKNISRFMSEYGFQSFPELKTVQSYATPKDWDIESEVMLHHQRHPRGNQLVREYMFRDYNKPKDFASFLYVGQVLQAEIIKFGAEAHRRAMPYNMGSLYWQLDDCWPVASWSGMDYYGRWKAQHYFARKFNEPLLVSIHEQEDDLEIYVVSDLLEKTKGVLTCTLVDFKGSTIWESKIDTSIDGNSSKRYFNIKKEALPKHNTRDILLIASLKTGKGMMHRNVHYFEPPKDLLLPQVKLEPTIVQDGKNFKITFQSSVLAKNVYLSCGSEGFFTDNYFDLLPGETKTIHFRPAVPIALENFKKEIKMITLSDSY